VLSAALGTLLAVVVLAGAWFGVQAYTEWSVVNELMGRIQALDKEREELEQEIDVVAGRIAATGPDAPGSADLIIERERKEARLTTVFLKKRSILAAIIGYTHPDVHEGATKMAREQIKDVLHELIEQEDYAIAEALATSTLESIADGNVVGYSAEETAGLKRVAAEAEIQLEREIRTSPRR
jgi:hypothetical protein